MIRLPPVVRSLLLAGSLALATWTALGSSPSAAAASKPLGCGVHGPVPTVNAPATVAAGSCSPGYLRVAGLRVGDTLQLALTGAGTQVTVFTTSPSGDPEFANGQPGGVPVCEVIAASAARADCQLPQAGTYLVQTLGHYTQVGLAVSHARGLVGTRPGSCSAAAARAIAFSVQEFGIGGVCNLSRLFFTLTLRAGERILMRAMQGPKRRDGVRGLLLGGDTRALRPRNDRRQHRLQSAALLDAVRVGWIGRLHRARHGLLPPRLRRPRRLRRQPRPSPRVAIVRGRRAAHPDG